MMKNLHDIRNDYSRSELSERTAAGDPFVQFGIWFEQMLSEGFAEPTAMALSTVQGGRPSSRIVLLKSYDEKGFVFYTNYESRKGREAEGGEMASLLFYWDSMERQVRIEGCMERVGEEESDAYFDSRPYKSKIGARVSQQSRPLATRMEMMRAAVREMHRYPDSPPRPRNWGGYRLVPDYFEFWQGRRSRLHDRIIYRKREEGWETGRLYP